METRELLNQSEELAGYASLYATKRNQIRLLENVGKIGVDEMITKDSVYLISFSGDYSATVIKDELLARQQKMLFKLLWEQSKQIT
mgnify:CR=1 FL=1